MYNFRTIAVGKVHGIDLIPDFMTREAFVAEKSAQVFFDYLFQGAKFPITLMWGAQHVHE